MTFRSVFRSDRVEALDFALSAAGSMFAVYSVGISLARPAVGWFFVIGVALGAAVSFLLNRIRALKPGWDAYLYFTVGIISVFLTRPLNPILPEEGIPRELMVTGALCWMILMGSWTASSDSTLLFQIVPCISLFALVGAIDTYKGATFAFFLFLLCAATLYARANHRIMLRRAEESGYPDVENIRQGPWRWIAGPEWALVSAFVVVLISLIGAPVIRNSVQGVAGAVSLPTPPAPQQPRSAIGSPTAPTSFRIGQGPRVLSEEPIFRAKLDRQRYLRVATYRNYTGSGWSRPTGDQASQTTAEQLRADRRAVIRSGNMQVVEFTLSLDTPFVEQVPVPGEVIELQPPLSWQIFADGTVAAGVTLPPMAKLTGRAAVPKDGIPPRDSPLPIPEHLWPFSDSIGVSDRIAQLAETVTANAKTDYERALAIQAEIERRCRYNLRAEATPPGEDPVETFLFGPTKEGYCDLFASSMALMARSVGIPSRVATGYFPVSGERDAAGWYVLRESDAHAWAELYFEGFGWIPFDPTEGAEAVPGGERGRGTLEVPLFEQAWFQWLYRGLLAAAALLGIGLIGASLVANRLAGRVEAVALARAYERFVSALQKTANRPRRLHETPMEYAQSVAENLGAARDAALELTGRFEVAFYANGHPSKPAASELTSSVAEFERLCRNLKSGRK